MSEIGPNDPRVLLAQDRTVLAAERTYAAWLRTGLAFLSVGLAAQHFLAGAAPGWALRLIALALIVSSFGCFSLAAWRDHTLRRHLAGAEVPMTPQAVTLGIAGLLALISGLAAATLRWA